MCEPSQTTLHLKNQVHLCLLSGDDKSATPSSLQIQTTDGTILKDEDGLDSLQNEEELYVCLPISDGEWETVDIVSLESNMAE